MRIVHTQDQGIQMDLTGKKAGRGAKDGWQNLYPHYTGHLTRV
ncbi:MAG: hypothetical protein ACQEXV_06950 [Bacillota bacterium]